MYPRRPLKERFLRFVSPEPNTGCWLWLGGSSRRGYGSFAWRINGRWSMPAHRASWEIFRGPIPESFGGGAKVCVCHKCDVPACVNPDHLFLGRSADNNRDRDRKGRQARGERSGSRLYPEKHRGVLQGRRAKLNDQKVRDIRSLYAAGGWRFEDLAQKFGVSDSCIDFVVNKRSWKHVVEGGLS